MIVLGSGAVLAVALDLAAAGVAPAFFAAFSAFFAIFSSETGSSAIAFSDFALFALAFFGFGELDCGGELARRTFGAIDGADSSARAGVSGTDTDQRNECGA